VWKVIFPTTLIRIFLILINQLTHPVGLTV
jgi:hypothetical protein